ncbi:hydroxyacid-oxoacid transhydrogenase [Aureococcus anophagefferens]|uniref:Hydroxyacid-oxoacid transhydrogenase n=1 Tax=Aureococcus anophagefferens TaxID=44056 RepID=A0ABR1G1R9_AURAN|nr:hydroxyacid-oxoacid transhydrogenase [Aureococcus anophagefferens]
MVADAAASCGGCPVYSDVQGNPTEANVSGGVAAFKAHGCDGVIAFGGGSAMDAAKCVALMVGQDRPLFDFEDREDWCDRVDPAGMVPCVAVPTTSGTGSEAIALLDPELTLGLPKHVTAWVGIDALSHSMEAFSSPFYHPMAHGMALEGMRIVKDYLPRLMEDGADLEARSQLMVASTLGATAFQKGLGAMHSLTHAAGGLLNTQHGQTISVVMPYVLQHNRPAIADSFEALGRYLDLEDASVTGVTDWVLELRETCGIPNTLAEIGVDEAHVATLAPMAVEDPSSGSNPTPVTEQAATDLYLSAIRGKL